MSTDDYTESGPVTTDDIEGVSSALTNIQPIATRGHNTLWRAMRHGRWWLLKGIALRYAADEAHRRMLVKEFETMMRLQHPGIVQAHGLENVPELGPCIVMEWVEGMTLKQWLADGSHSAGECREVLRQLLDAVEYVHHAGIVHRDLKPSNIMIARLGGQVKIIDFGLADADSSATFKQAAGTRGYTSPEQLAGGEPDVRNDIYSLGVIIGELEPLAARYDGVVKRCTEPIDNRPADVAELRQLLRRADTARRTLFAGLAIAALLLAGMLSRYWLLPPPAIEDGKQITTEEVAAPVPQDSVVAAPTANVEPGQSLDKPRPGPAPEADKGHSPTSNDIVEKTIAEGIKRLESGFPSDELRHHLDTLTDISYFKPDLTYGGLRIVKAYLEEVGPSLTEAQQSMVATALYDRAGQIYETEVYVRTLHLNNKE